MTVSTTSGLATSGPTVEAVRHWHVTESDAGYLPDAEPGTFDDGALALDAMAHLLADWAQTLKDPEDPDASYAEGVAEQYCTCRVRSAVGRASRCLARVEDGRGLCEQIGDRVFELVCCRERDCLKYCPHAECGTVTAIGDTDTRCWCCGAAYVDAEACGWLA